MRKCVGGRLVGLNKQYCISVQRRGKPGISRAWERLNFFVRTFWSGDLKAHEMTYGKISYLCQLNHCILCSQNVARASDDLCPDLLEFTKTRLRAPIGHVSA